MDPDETATDADFSPRRKYRDLPPLETDETPERRPRGKSVRTRPSQIIEQQNAVPRSPLKDSAPGPQLQPRNSKMSLFSLFSRPKVEKARGYAEQGLAAQQPMQVKDYNASRSELVVQVDSNIGLREPPPRAPSAMSFRSVATKATSKSRIKGSTYQTAPTARKPGSWDPPPLFQAYPQSTKHGTLEVSTMAAETVLQKSKSWKAGGMHAPSAEMTPRDSVEESGNVDTRRSAKPTMRHVTNGSITHVDMPKKIFILVTSGYLLQYAELGPSDRLPEKVLQLGKDSAAFACDLIPGKHYVLQISQAVDQQGVVLASSGSIFSKLGLRSAATKRTTSNFLLVLPSAQEMENWMVAIREEIETLGGKNARTDMAIRPKTREAAEVGQASSELQKSPSRSHRYRVKRDPSKVSLLSKPSAEALDLLPPPPRIKDEDELSDTATIDGIEQEAEQLAEEARSSPAKPHREPDAQSLSSSIAVSEQQHRLNSLRNSQRMSHSTVATTVATSGPNSLSGSPPSDMSLKGSSETSRDSVYTKPSYRALSSYALNRRRSAMPMPTTREKPLPALDVSAQIQRHPTLTASPDSPVTGRNSPLPVSSASPRKLGVASSEPNLRAAAETKAKHDSKLPSPPMLCEEPERPQSIVGDLPSPSNWAPDRSPNKRLSLIQTATAQADAQRAGSRGSTRTSEPFRQPRRHSSQPFSLPLKINPSTPANRPPSRNQNHSSFNTVEEGTGKPVVHTLTAKIDPSHRLSGTPSMTSPIPELPAKNPARTSSGRLSLFPSHTPSPPLAAPPIADAPRRSPSATALSSYAQTQANGRTLKRPTSMQVRSDHAPFLRSVRNSTVGPAPAAANARSFTAPIRSLKPSRSSTILPVRPQPSPTDPFTTSSAATFVGASAHTATLPPTDEAADKPTPLLDQRTASPLLLRPPSRNSLGRRTMRARASLPELDLGIPVVGLGPPAPPPQAPLPAPPPASRPTSPMPGAAGLGIRV